MLLALGRRAVRHSKQFLQSTMSGATASDVAETSPAQPRTPSTSTGACTDDNPCWGGPEPRRHDLEYLLRVLGSDGSSGGTPPSGGIDGPSPPNIALSSPEEHETLIQRVRQRLILHEDDDYVAIDKPADLRMDGPHRATVHKLLLYLSPPPSLAKMASEEEVAGGESEGGGNEKVPDDALKRHNQLLKAIAPLSNRNFLSDDPHRMVHQLDYATSGVLLIGKTKKATGVASQAFEHRKTNKRYVAVVIHPPSDDPDDKSDDPPLGKEFLESLPTLPASSLDAWGDGSLEKRYRKKRQREMDDREAKKGTFEGYMPVQCVFDKWRAALLREKKAKERGGQAAAKKKRRRANDDLPPLPSPQRELLPEEIEELLSLGPSYKKVKSRCAKSDKDWAGIFEAMTKEYNASLLEHYARSSVDGESKSSGGREHASNLPPLFRIQGGEGRDANYRDVFYICAAIGEPKDGRFHVIVDPAVSKQPSLSSPLPELKPSLTKCTILWRGRLGADDEKIPVAKVLLQPWTGRRHQLRVHLAHVAGCPILGDVTYGGNLEDRGGSGERSSPCARMCLHAKELSIPLLGGNTKTFVAPDPFVVAKTEGHGNELLISPASTIQGRM